MCDSVLKYCQLFSAFDWIVRAHERMYGNTFGFLAVTLTTLCLVSAIGLPAMYYTSYKIK